MEGAPAAVITQDYKRRWAWDRRLIWSWLLGSLVLWLAVSLLASVVTGNDWLLGQVLAARPLVFLASLVIILGANALAMELMRSDPHGAWAAVLVVAAGHFAAWFVFWAMLLAQPGDSWLELGALPLTLYVAWPNYVANAVLVPALGWSYFRSRPSV